MILAFHGCPGFPTDFNALSEALKQYPGAATLQAIVRKGYPGADLSQSRNLSGAHYLGYSFGSADCVEAAAADPSAKSVILIAPYLFPTKEASPAMKALLSIPLLSSTLLSLLGPKAMRELVVRTAYPDTPSAEYQATGQSYAKPAILRVAMTETSGRAQGIRSALETLDQRGLPILVIWAKQDQVCPESEQILPLRALLSNSQANLKEVTLDQAGHALLWTRPTQLAQAIHSFTQSLSGAPSQEPKI